MFLMMLMTAKTRATDVRGRLTIITTRLSQAKSLGSVLDANSLIKRSNLFLRHIRQMLEKMCPHVKAAALSKDNEMDGDMLPSQEVTPIDPIMKIRRMTWRRQRLDLLKQNKSDPNRQSGRER